LKQGERIRLIRESAQVLLKNRFEDAQLILDQFGIRVYDPDDGYGNYDLSGYYIGRVKTANDVELSELHMYLTGLDAESRESNVSDEPWESLSVKLFISHKYEDREFVGLVKYYLEKYDINAFVAHDDIEPNELWRTVIKSALSSCDSLVALMHPDFHSSQWCDQEVGWALGRNIPVAAIRRQSDQRTPDGFLEERQDISIGSGQSRPEAHIAWKIFMLILNDSRTHEKGQRALAEAMVKSFSFDNTRALWPLIEQEPRWESDQLRRMEYAVSTNSQVYGAFLGPVDIPTLVQQLVAKFESSGGTVGDDDPWSSMPTV